MFKETLIKIQVWILFLFCVLICPCVMALIILFDIFKSLFKRLTPKAISGEIALVTGAAHGLGRCIALELAKKGCHIAVVDINMEGAKETVELIKRNYNVKAKAYQVDISSYEEVAALNKQLIDDLGIVTILINNAGIILLTSNREQPDWREVQRMLNVNLAAHFWTTQIFLPNMKARKMGHIVAVSSLSALMALAWHSQYTSTKFAVRGLMRALRMELKANRHVHGNIYATTVFPSFLKTHKDVESLVKEAGINLQYPTISGEVVAERLVQGIQRNEEEIVVPQVFGYLYKMFEFIPSYCQDVILHHMVVKKLQNSYSKVYTTK